MDIFPRQYLPLAHSVLCKADSGVEALNFGFNTEQEPGEQFGRGRALSYNRLHWATDTGYLSAFMDFCDLRPHHRVLDLGSGTGLVAGIAAQKVRSVTAIDISRAMIDIARKRFPHLPYTAGDARRLPFAAGSFDRVLARMVLHHITSDTASAIREAWRVLRPGGWFVVSEGVPPAPEILNDYRAIFSMKEERLSFLPADLVTLLKKGGFNPIVLSSYVIPRVSVSNWLEGSGLDPDTKVKILDLHLDARPEFKRAYRLQTTDTGDCLIDFTFCLIKGMKRRGGSA